MLKNLVCSVCEGGCDPLDVVDFNKSCEEVRGKFLPLSGNPVYYYLCNQCGFCFSPSIYKWKLKDFSKNIYNKQYAEVDPDYELTRPKTNADNLINAFKDKEADIKHIDYGGGNGRLSNFLRLSGWNSESYDPFYNETTNISTLGKFNLVTAFEVFEHVPDVNNLLSDLNLLLEDEGLIIFSTLLSDGNIFRHERLNWWYASPRNGHISLFSRKSLEILASKYHFQFASFSHGLHLLFRQQIPTWAEHIIKRN